MAQDSRNEHDHDRREDDRRWLKVQKDVMDIVTTQRTNQQMLASLEVEIGKLEEHVEEVDEHLRGVGGKESLDTRMVLMEREAHKDSVLLHHMVKKFESLERTLTTQLNAITSDLSNMKFQDVLEDKANKSKGERFKEWMKLWGSIILATIALIVPLAKLTFDNWDKMMSSFHSQKSMTSNVDLWMSAIEKRKHDPKTRKRLRETYGNDVD